MKIDWLHVVSVLGWTALGIVVVVAALVVTFAVWLSKKGDDGTFDQ